MELLKLRFGEDEMHKCEVMLKDLADSKRLDNLVHEKSALKQVFTLGSRFS